MDKVQKYNSFSITSTC